MARKRAELEKRMNAPGMGLRDIGYFANELGEEYERADRPEEALRHYRQAVWAFEYHQRLTGA
ncbi:MAG: hypothetical protein V1918_08430, partial [Planctomycetota bacterium]